MYIERIFYESGYITGKRDSITEAIAQDLQNAEKDQNVANQAAGVNTGVSQQEREAHERKMEQLRSELAKYSKYKRDSKQIYKDDKRNVKSTQKNIKKDINQQIQDIKNDNTMSNADKNIAIRNAKAQRKLDIQNVYNDSRNNHSAYRDAYWGGYRQGRIAHGVVRALGRSKQKHDQRERLQNSQKMRNGGVL